MSDILKNCLFFFERCGKWVTYWRLWFAFLDGAIWGTEKMDLFWSTHNQSFKATIFGQFWPRLWHWSDRGHYRRGHHHKNASAIQPGLRARSSAFRTGWITAQSRELGKQCCSFWQFCQWFKRRWGRPASHSQCPSWSSSWRSPPWVAP